MAEDFKKDDVAPVSAKKAVAVSADDKLKERIAQATPETPGAAGIDLIGHKKVSLPNGITIENN